MSGETRSNRQDRAVVMARGRSERMGAPKGMLRLSRSGLTFIRIIVDLYLDAGFPVDVVAGLDTAEIYRCELPEREDVRVLAAEPGGDTALTLLAAWRSCQAEPTAGSHFWAHPVDLPLVTSDTIAALRDNSVRDPDRVIRPVVKGTPGHPVILPRDVLACLSRQDKWQGGPLREFLGEAEAAGLLSSPLQVAFEDPGIIHDFDHPDDLGFNPSSSENRGAP